MRNRILAALLFAASYIFADNIGQWRAYMAYGDITDIEPAGDMVYVLSSNSIFSYNINDESVNTYDKVSTLNDCTITNIAWNSIQKRLIILYDNYNIDLLDNNGEAYNISDYYTKTMTEDKHVNNIIIIDKYAYLCTNFGILQIDMNDCKVAETYNLKKRVNSCNIKDGYMYASTSDGNYKCLLGANMADPANWLPTQDNISFTGDNDIIISTANGYTEYIAYDKHNKCYWSNEKSGTMQSYTLDTNNVRTVTRSGIGVSDAPKYNYFGKIKLYDNVLYTCNGIGWDWKHPASIQTFDITNDTWYTYSNEGIAEQLDIRYQDIIDVAVDPNDNRRLMAGSQAGLFEFYDSKLTNHWNYENSPIYTHYNVKNEYNKNYQVITALQFDNSGNLWVANTGSRKNILLKLNADNTWSIPDNGMSGDMSEYLLFMGFDTKGKLWMHDNVWGTAAVYNYDTTTEELTKYSNFTNEDNVSYSNIAGCRTLAEDKEGNIWVGLSEGLFVLTPEYQNDPTKGFYQVKVPRNDGTNYADYLLAGVDISAIAIDNANRKWVGTHGNGIYLISADNMVEEKHFTAANSKLLSDDILNLAIDNTTGKVYIGTDKGLCSYQSEASQTNDEMNEDNVWAYPNPVTPEYRGMITVTGLSLNADVKITTSNGVLVAQGRSTGGSFQWDGKDMKGNRVASGIYMVQTATASGEKGTVCKIAMIK